MKHIIFLFLFYIFNFIAFGQVKNIDQKVISSGWSYDSTSSLIISSTIGETVILNKVIAPYDLAQGFQQVFRNSNISFVLNLTGPLCLDRSNGFAIIDSIIGCQGPYDISWSNADTGTIAKNLGAGPHSVTVTSFDNCVQTTNFEIEFINDLPCLLKFYTGITPNGDALNEQWIIDNIELLPSNKVDIYNRLGNRVWKGVNYDNITTVWSGENLSGAELTSDTYFYVFVSGSQVEKGWIELTR